MARTPYYTKAEADAKRQETYREIKQTTQSISAGEGGKLYDTLAEAQAVTPKPVNGTVFQVSSITDSVNAALYTFQSSEATGVRFERELGPLNSDLGITIIPPKNFLQEASETPVTDTDFWGEGFLNSTGGVSGSAGWWYSKGFIEAYPASYDTYLKYYGNARILAFDKDYNLIEAIPNPTGTTIYSFTLVLPENTAYIKISTQSSNTSLIKMINLEPIKIVSTEIFATSEFVASEDLKVKEELGIKTVPIQTNFLQELRDTSVEDTDVWGEGFLYKLNGEVTPYEGWYYSKKYYRVVPGEFSMYMAISGNGAVVFYDKDFEIVSILENTSSPTTYNFETVIIPEGVEFVRISYNSASHSSLHLSNKTELIIKDSPFITTSGIKENESIPINGKGIIKIITKILKDTHPVKPKIPMVSFISDDGRFGNDEWYIPILDEKGIKSTFAIVSSWTDNTEMDAFSSERVRELYSLGHDIAGHTHTHPNLSELTTEQADIELRKSKTFLQSLGVDPQMFVAPFGGRNLASDKLIRQYFKTDFITLGDINLPPIDSFRINRFSFDAGTNGVSTLQTCKNAVDLAVQEGGWVVFAVHPQYPEYHLNSNPSGYEQRKNDLRELIDYIKNLEVPILTAKQAFELYKNPIQIGNIRLDDRYYVVGMDGTESGNYFE